MAFEIGKFAGKLASTRPRTIEAVTEEILDIKQRVAEDFMELGQRLCEAKELLPHGEWLPWLANNVQFSERQAQKFMALAKGYESNPQLAADFGSEKAFALLDLPMEEREQIAAEGATVNGKTKSPADLTTRDVKQLVAERKVVSGVDLAEGQSFSVDAAHAYVAARAAEQERFFELLWEYRDTFSDVLRVCEDRKDGIFMLKERFKYSSSRFGTSGFSGSSKGLQLCGEDRVYIERTWTEVWDMLAVMALQEIGQNAKQKESLPQWQKLDDEWPNEGQMVLLSYENGIGGFQYQIARCVGSTADVWPFIDPNNELTCEEFENFTHWIALTERTK